MEKINLHNGGYLYYSNGNFDEWCVYEVDENGNKSVPRDVDYFLELKKISKIFSRSDMYNDFVKIYDITNNLIEELVIREIELISKHYEEYSDDIFRIFSTIYMGMIAEENKKNTKLGKRIKRLGVYNLLIKNKDPLYCANFMKGKKWFEIDQICKEGGF